MTDYDATNRRHIRLAQKAAKLAETQRREAILGIMGNKYGRSWMWDILLRCHVFSSSFVPSALATAFAEGERNIGLQFINDIMGNCPDLYVTMAQEANEKELIDVARRRNTSESDSPDSSDSAYASDTSDGYAGEDGEGDFPPERGT